MAKTTTPRMSVFLLIWFGQSISAIGTQLTLFALGVWVFNETRSVTLYALMSFSASLPGIIMLPLIGTLVDRWDRRRIMILSDIGSGLVSLSVVFLLTASHFEVWHIYIVMGLNSIFASFQWPAFSSSITVLVPKQHHVRANGMVEGSMAVAQIMSPLLAGLLFGSIHIQGLISIDVVTFLFAVGTALMVRFPRVAPSTDSAASRGSLWQESRYGWRYIRSRPGLLGLLLFLAFVNFSMSMVIILLTPLILGFTSAASLGLILSLSGIGMLLGTLFVSVWGGPKRRIHGIFGFVLVQALLLFLGGQQPSVPLIAGAASLFMFCNPIIITSSQGIWQVKVPPDVQGRVFAIRRMIALSTVPLAYLVAGPLADTIFEPLMSERGVLAGSIGQLIGVGPGRGIGLLFIILGLLTLVVALASYLNPRIRNVEVELPDAVEDREGQPAGMLGDVQSLHSY